MQRECIITPKLLRNVRRPDDFRQLEDAQCFCGRHHREFEVRPVIPCIHVVPIHIIRDVLSSQIVQT